VPYPDDGQPNLREGWETIPLARASRFNPNFLLDELWEDFCAGSASIITDRTEKVYRYDWGIFRAWLDEIDMPPILGSLTKQRFVDYIAELQRRPKRKGEGSLSSHTVSHYTRVLRTFVRWLVTEQLYPDDPFAGGPRGIMPRLGPRLLKVAKEADLDILLDGSEAAGRTPLERAVRGRDEFVIWLDGDTGVRTADITNFRIGDISLADGWATVRKGKWDRERAVPLSRETVAAMRVYLRRHRPILSGVRPDDVRPDDRLILSATGRPLTPNGLYQAMCRAYRRGGGTGRFGLHRLRHLFGTQASEGGMHPRISQEIMGHEDEKSQRIYQHPSSEVVKAEHAKITPIRSIKRARRRKLA
jgi:site-specific recombinase XerD